MSLVLCKCVMCVFRRQIFFNSSKSSAPVVSSCWFFVVRDTLYGVELWNRNHTLQMPKGDLYIFCSLKSVGFTKSTMFLRCFLPVLNVFSLSMYLSSWRACRVSVVSSTMAWPFTALPCGISYVFSWPHSVYLPRGWRQHGHEVCWMPTGRKNGLMLRNTPTHIQPTQCPSVHADYSALGDSCSLSRWPGPARNGS